MLLWIGLGLFFAAAIAAVIYANTGCGFKSRRPFRRPSFVPGLPDVLGRRFRNAADGGGAPCIRADQRRQRWEAVFRHEREPESSDRSERDCFGLPGRGPLYRCM